jgi:hypothetical protein
MHLRRASRRRAPRGALATWAMLAGAAVVVPSGTATAAPTPIVSASVATQDGTLIGPIAVRAKQVRVKVGSKRCSVAAGTPLAALVALKAKAKAPQVGRIALKDYGSCGSRPSRSSRLYLTGIGSDVASGPDGWIYDVGGKGGSTSAADPAGPFGRGRIKAGAEVHWRWCRASQDPEGDCGDALAITAIGLADVLTPAGGGRLSATVKLVSGSDGNASGTAAPAPLGTAVELRSPSGAVLAQAATTDGGSVSLDLPANVPAGSRLVASGAAGVAPAGTLWPALR